MTPPGHRSWLPLACRAPRTARRASSTDSGADPPGVCSVSGMRDDWRTDRIGSALRGANPSVLRRLDAGFAAMGDVQFLPGYAVLLTDDATVRRLSDLPRARRLAFLSDMDQLGEAVERACGRLDPAFRRVNLEILGNSADYLHAHVWPRFEWEAGGVRDRAGVAVPAREVERRAVRARSATRCAADGDRRGTGPVAASGLTGQAR